MTDEFRVQGGPLSETLGYEITDFDVRSLTGGPETDAIKALLYEHQVLCFRDQDLEPHDLVAFTGLFGPPDPHVLQQFTKPGHPEIFVLSNIVENGVPLGTATDGFGWHTDLTYLPLPAAYTILYGVETPPEGGNTEFASLYRAYDSLSESEKDFLRPLNGTYNYAKLYAKRKDAPPLTAEQKARTPDVVHPLVRIHPHTGREGMYINRSDFLGVDGLPSEAIFEKVETLFKYTIDNFRYAHQWKPRDLVIWDNRGLLHRATEYDRTAHRRLVYRTTVQGEKPIGWAEAAAA